MPCAWRRLIRLRSFWSVGDTNFSVFYFYYLGLFFEMIHEPLSLEEGTLAEADLGLPCPWQKGGGETSAIGREALRVVDYVDLSMSYVPLWISWIISSIITNRASDRYSEHSKVSIISPTRTHATNKIENWLQRHSHQAGETVQDVQKRTRGEWDGGEENKNTHTTQITLNKQKLGEP